MESFNKRGIRNKTNFAKKKKRNARHRIFGESKNYDISETTWEPKTNLTIAQIISRQFRKAIKKRCYDLNLNKKSLPRNVRQNLVWPFWQIFSDVPNVQNIQNMRDVGNVPNVPDAPGVPDVPLHIYISLFRK